MTGGGDLHESLHGERVRQLLRERIAAAGGWLPFDEYMQVALYEPGLGYYSAGARKLGAGGDFTTAPEISPLFGQCLAAHCGDVLGALGGGDVLEIGAGTGKLACDVLQQLDVSGQLPQRYRILEISADLRQRQQRSASVACLRGYPAWSSGSMRRRHSPGRARCWPMKCWMRCPCGGFVTVSAKERSHSALQWMRTAHSPGRLRHDDALAREVARVREALPRPWPDGYESELCLVLQPWLLEVTASLQSGVALFIDYGLPRREYFHPDRSQGTLRCHYRQQAHDDPFAHPGLEDITAWVDFTRVAEAADAAGLRCPGLRHAGRDVAGPGHRVFRDKHAR